jgi:hypothetical protein
LLPFFCLWLFLLHLSSKVVTAGKAAPEKEAPGLLKVVRAVLLVRVVQLEVQLVKVAPLEVLRVAPLGVLRVAPLEAQELEQPMVRLALGLGLLTVPTLVLGLLTVPTLAIRQL